MKIPHGYILTLLCVLFCSCGSNSTDVTGNNTNVTEVTELLPVAVTKSNKMKVYAHYMPWFETPATNSGSWGQHWTMATCNPNIENSGKRQIASYYYPLTGPYASSDDEILDYQCLLMKYSGIDGIMIDWYGTQYKKDYPSNLRNSEAVIKAVTRAGLSYAIVYEDNTLQGLSDKVAQARIDINYLATNHFKNANYVKVDGKPLLLIFGPQQISTPKDWDNVFSILATKPEFIVLNSHSSLVNDATYKNSEGEFLWVNDKPDYSVAKQYDYYIAGAMPGFKDYYKAGGWGNGYTTYDSDNGNLFNRQLQSARDAGLDMLQISTWNDYGEGTVIEPTQEFGYKYLTALQQFTQVNYRQHNLELIYKWYQFRVTYSDSVSMLNILKQCYYYFVSLQPDKAESLINNIK